MDGRKLKLLRTALLASLPLWSAQAEAPTLVITRGELTGLTAPQSALGEQVEGSLKRTFAPDTKLEVIQASSSGTLVRVPGSNELVTINPDAVRPDPDSQKSGPEFNATDENCKGVQIKRLPRTAEMMEQPAPSPLPTVEAPMQGSSVNGVKSLAAQNEIVQEVQKIAIRDAALASRDANQRSIASDGVSLSNYYADLPLPEMAGYLSRARTEISRTLATLDEAVKTDTSGEAARFRNVYMNARDKAEAANQVLADELKGEKPGTQPLPGMGSANHTATTAAALSRTTGLNEVFGGFDASKGEPKLASPQDALVNRVLMLSGLPEKQKREAMKKLRLVEPVKFRLPGGKSAQVPIVHNGYIWGGGKTGVDCSSFVSSLVSPQLNDSRFTTFDFAAMWEYLTLGRIPKPPYRFKKEREKEVRAAAEGFLPVNLYNGEPLAVGDILVFRLPWVAVGHIFIVSSYDPRAKVAKVVEAAQSAGTVRERDFPLSLEPASAKNRWVRPGLMGLRLKQSDNAVCKFKDHSFRKKNGGGQT